MNLYNSKSILIRIFCNYVKPYKTRVATTIFFMLITAICNASVVKLIQPAVDKIFVAQNKSELIIIPAMIVLISLCKGIAEYYQQYSIKFLGQRILTDIQMQLYNHLLHSDLKFIHTTSSAKLISRFTNDINLMRGTVSNLLVGCAKHFLSIFFLLVVMIRLEPTLTFLTFMVFPVIIYPVRKLSYKVRIISNYAQEQLAIFTAKLDETFRSIKIVKSFQSEDIEYSRAQDISNIILKSYKTTAKYEALISPIMEVLSGLAIGGIIWYGGMMIIAEETTTGALFTFITAFASAYRPFKSLISLNMNFQEGIIAAKRIFDILDSPPKIIDNEQSQKFDNISNCIEFKNVNFDYEGDAILKNFNLKVVNDKIFAIVGRSGSGKSTIINLLLRFFDPQTGNIAINNEDIKEILIKSLRNHISLVSQDTFLFNITIAENIAYGHKNFSKESIIYAAKMAGADDFINNMPNKYDTLISDQGLSFSGGQRQKLSIARAFFKNSAIIILDEATSALDPISEKIVLKSLTQLKKNKIIIMISHRLDSIKIADTIVLLKDGQIIEQGNYFELMNNKSDFYQIFSNPFLKYTD